MSKSRGERGNKTPNVNQNATPAQNTIIPGRFTECDWNDLVENETCEEFVSDIVGDIADVACDIIFHNIINDRTAPYAVFAAKELLLEFVEWEFIRCDDGENVPEQQAWCEDNEPVACVTDSWAQGAVPVVNTINVLRREGSETVTLEKNNMAEEEGKEEEGSDETKDNQEGDEANDQNVTVEADKNNNPQEESKSNENKSDKQRTESDENVKRKTETFEQDLPRNPSLKKPSVDSAPMESGSSKQNRSNVSLSPVPPKGSKKKAAGQRNSNNYKKHKGSLPTFTAISLSPVTDDRPKPGAGALTKDRHGAPIHSSDSLFKHQHGRPPGVKEVVYNESGDVVRVQKINIASLPDHRVKTKCLIIDPPQQNTKKASQNSKGSDSTTYLNTQTNKTNIKNKIDPNILMNQATGQNPDVLRALRTQSPDVLRTLRTPLPPSMVDTADISEGVVIKEGVLSRSGPKVKPLAYVDEQSLKPIQSGRGRKLDVHDIINKTKPTLNSYSRSKPLPAILM